MPKTIKTKAAIVLIGCGFRRRPMDMNDTTALSVVDIARGRKACQEYTRLHNPDSPPFEFWTTGQVAWTTLVDAPKNTTLAGLNAIRIQTSLNETQVGQVPSIIRQVPGHTPFSECWNAVKMARAHDIKKLVIVASCFYFSLYRQMWEAAAKREGVQTNMIIVRHDRGVVSPATWKAYQSFGLQALVSVASGSRIGHLIVMNLIDFLAQSRISKGYQVDGHTSL